MLIDMLVGVGYTIILVAAFWMLGRIARSAGACWAMALREWRDLFKGEQRPRRGYLRVEYSGDERSARVYVVPDDGTAPVEMPVARVTVMGSFNNYVTAKLRMGVGELDVIGGADESATKITGAAKPGFKLKPGGVSVTGLGGVVKLVKGFVWAYDAGERFPRLYLSPTKGKDA